MKRTFLCIVAALCICSSLLLSCTKSEDGETKMGAIDRMTEKAGKEMADRLTDPLERARKTKEMIDKNYSDMDENLENQ